MPEMNLLEIFMTMHLGQMKLLLILIQIIKLLGLLELMMILGKRFIQYMV